jgi:hypothetical protein
MRSEQHRVMRQRPSMAMAGAVMPIARTALPILRPALPIAGAAQLFALAQLAIARHAVAVASALVPVGRPAKPLETTSMATVKFHASLAQRPLTTPLPALPHGIHHAACETPWQAPRLLDVRSGEPHLDKA